MRLEAQEASCGSVHFQRSCVELGMSLALRAVTRVTLAPPSYTIFSVYFACEFASRTLSIPDLILAVINVLTSCMTARRPLLLQAVSESYSTRARSSTLV